MFKRIIAALPLALAAAGAYAQSITTTPAAAPAAVPVNHPGLLVLLGVVLVLAAFALLRAMGLSFDSLRRGALSLAVALVGVSAMFSDAVIAQLQQLDRAFTQALGETLPIPVQATQTGGVTTGFLPAVFTNTTGVQLRVSALTEPAWDTCFPTGAPVSPLTVPPVQGAECAVGASLAPQAACVVDVVKACNAAAAAVQGNAPSMLVADTANVQAGGTVNGDVLTNDSDADGPLQVTRFEFEGTTYLAGQTAQASGRGDFTLQASGVFQFTAADPFTPGDVVVTYYTHTGAHSTLTISVNRPPVANDDAATVLRDGSVNVSVRTNDSDPDADALTVTGFTPGTKGSVAIDGGSGNPIYTPNAGYVGGDSFTYTLSDGRGGSDTATVTLTVTAPPVVNHAPTAANDSANTDSNTAVTIAVRGNDVDPDSDALTVTAVTQGANGSVAIDPVSGNPVYTPNAGFVGTDPFTYTISDGAGGTDTATVTVTVAAPPNRPPVAQAHAFSSPQNTTTTIPSANLLATASDPDVGDTVTFVSAQDAVNGSVSVSPPNVVFTPTATFEGLASFTYTVRDPHGATATATVNITVGSVSAPSLVVQRALVVIAHGTVGTSVKFPIITRLVDTDGSESLSIKISGVPTGLSFSAGSNMGGGVWQFAEADLPNLVLNLPGSYTTNATNMTVQVTSTESNGGATATTSTVVTLKADYTTVNITTTESGSHNGDSADEYIQGGAGNNTINGSSGNNIILGGAGNDTLSAGAGSDVINGGSGNDSINSGSGADVISGGPGNDTLIGGAAGENFVDMFVWTLGDQGAAGTPAVDTIQNFATAAAETNASGGDVLNLRDLLQGESVGASNGAGNLANYLHFEVSGGNTTIHISHTGGFGADSHSVGGSYTSGAETQRIVLTGVDMISLYSGATTDQQIITQLLNNHKLIVD